MTANADGHLAKAQIITSIDDKGVVTVMLDFGMGDKPALMAQAAPMVSQSERAMTLLREAMVIAFRDLMSQHNILSTHVGSRKTK